MLPFPEVIQALLKLFSHICDSKKYLLQRTRLDKKSTRVVIAKYKKTKEKRDTNRKYSFIFAKGRQNRQTQEKLK